MPISNPPILDARYEDITERTEALAIAFTQTTDDEGNVVAGWVPPPDGGMDMGRALIQVFARMASQALERINRVPDRSMLAFLDRVGLLPAQARSARVPLTFTLVERGDSEPTVPAGTRVGATALSGDTREVVFETERDLRTTRTKLAALFVRQSDGDRLAECTATALASGSGFFEAFDGGETSPHELYLAADEVLALAAGTTVTVAFAVSDTSKWQALITSSSLPVLANDAYYASHIPSGAPLIAWRYFNGTAWTSLSVTASGTSVSFSIPADVASVSVNGAEALWIRGMLQAWPADEVPQINGVTFSALSTTAATTPDAAFAVGQEVDLSIPFYPFGEEPKRNNALLVACEAALARSGTVVTVTITLDSETEALKSADAPVLTWEISTGASTWKKIADVTPSGSTVNDVLRTKTFTVPTEAAATTVGSTTAVWIRIRLSSGSFGKGISVSYSGGTAAVSDDGYRPPMVASITMSATATVTNSDPVIVTNDDFAFTTCVTPFVPFVRVNEGQVLYLGFDRAFTPTDTYLYFQVAPLEPQRVAEEANASVSGKVTWQYWSTETSWTWLPTSDETRAFVTSGLLQFVAPADMARHACFGKDLYWIRAVYEVPDPPPVSPRLGRVLTNTVTGRDIQTRYEEVLGSSTGQAGRSYKLAASPVLEGERIEVRGTDGVWTVWQGVPDFYSSGAQDNHYTIDRAAGIVRFGDGRRGMVPPRGTRNVRVAMYATGGGAIGNRPAFTVTQLKTTVPYVDGVTNNEAATGGANADTTDDVKTWGPSVLRHGYRAVTAEDYEDLALAASPAVARARVLTPSFDAILAADTPASGPSGTLAPGNVTVLIAATGTDLPPAATTGLLGDVDAYIRARASAGVAFRVAGPTWVEVRIDSLVVTAASSKGNEALRRRIEDALRAFFHPITGNVDGAGWAFGTLPHESDVYRLVMGLSGVDRVGVLTWTMRLPDGTTAPTDDEALSRVLIYPGSQTVDVRAPGGM